MTETTEDELVAALSKVLLNNNDNDDDELVEGLDEDLVSYIAGMLASKAAEEVGSDPSVLAEAIDEVLLPFLESVHCPEELVKQAETAVLKVLHASHPSDDTANPATGELHEPTRKLRQGIVSMSSDLGKQTEEEAEANRYLWGADQGVKAMANTLIDAHQDKSSAKEKRKARKAEAERARKLLASAKDEDVDQDASGGLVRMNFQTLTGNAALDKKKDVQVRNVTVSLDNGATLLESSELKFAYQRRYGLIGENGVGKSTLLKAIARGEEGGIEGFPRHLRVLHVRQEVPAHISQELTVTDAVLQSDVERMSLLQQEKELLAKLESDGGDEALSLQEKRKKLSEKANDGGGMAELNADLKKLDHIYARLQVLSSDSAESRAAMILTGLQFTPEMQKSPISSLSGGWRMRVALAAALFIEPDICMVSHLKSALLPVTFILLKFFVFTFVVFVFASSPS